ncbi:site-specific DNA methylase [Cenarchaeum symbiosum A]|uniref:site-specific DNA-methyltransferase (adenine-specific) n=1 Tax=Cenarchaeum symbiosum (strain A) TaxID=414004 RepID=A0RV26_CENSY|nr:site-specific DNA methylase [Cenarchaeum symbiosum A]
MACAGGAPVLNRVRDGRTINYIGRAAAGAAVEQFTVRNGIGRGGPKLIPYIGCKSGFMHIFDQLVPDDPGRIYDIFGGGGSFAFYACGRFGAKKVVYNDHNPVVANLVRTLQRDPGGLHAEYQKHYSKSSPEYYLGVRDKDLLDGTRGAGRFFYLAKNAFSGKIRFNTKNKFNSPMRKGARCPRVDADALRSLASSISGMEITCRDFAEYDDISGSFVYLDPPYMNNPNGHYNAVVGLDEFSRFVQKIEGRNRVMISEQNDPDSLRLSPGYTIFKVSLRRSLQYFTQNGSSEIIAVNYDAGHG